MDAAKSILKTYTGHEAASEGDDGNVQVYETMTDLTSIAILELLNKQEVSSQVPNMGEIYGALAPTSWAHSTAP